MARMAYALVLLLVVASAIPLSMAAKDLPNSQAVEVRRETLAVVSPIVSAVDSITSEVISLGSTISLCNLGSVLELLSGTGPLATIIKTLFKIVNEVIKLLAGLLGKCTISLSVTEGAAITTALESLCTAIEGLVHPITNLVQSLLKGTPKGLLYALGQLLVQLLQLVKNILDCLLNGLIKSIPGEVVALNSLLNSLDSSLNNIISSVLTLCV